MAFQPTNFLAFYPPTNTVVPPQQAIDWYAGKVPAELMEFWRTYGCGNFGNGIIKIVDPSVYYPSIFRWWCAEDYSRVPIAVTGFGDIFYLRNWPEGGYDISLLEAHYAKSNVITASLDDFFNRYLCDEQTRRVRLRAELFAAAQAKCGPIDVKECYFFVPALCLGGAEDIRFVEKGDAAVHHYILFSLLVPEP
jgi:hypothetical protein